MQVIRTLAGALAVATLTLGCAGPAAADEWPVYGADLANSRDGGSSAPSVKEAGSLKQAWRFETSDSDFTGTPVVAANTVVAASNGGSVFALDAATGRQLWTRDVNEPINGTATIDAAGGLVYVPIATPDHPHLLALRLSNGAVAWDAVLSTEKGTDVYGSPVVWNGMVFIGTSADQGDVSKARGTVVALDAATGALRWRTYTVPPGFDGAPVWSTPAIDTETGRLYVGTGNAYHEPAADTTDAMMVLDAATGQILGHFQATAGDAFDAADSPAGPDADFGASPNLFTGPDGRKLVGEGQKAGVYWALDRATMQPVWKTTVGGPGSLAGGIVGSTAYDGTRLYGPDSTASEIWALTGSGELSWISVEPGPINFSPVAVANGVLYTTDFSAFLTARDAGTGAILAKFPIGAPTFGGVSVAEGMVFAAVGTQKNPSGAIVAFGRHSPSAPPNRPPAPPNRPPPSGGAKPRLRLTVRPRATVARRLTRFRFRVTVSGPGSPGGTTIALAGRRVRASRTGMARMRVRLPRAGRYQARATKPNFRPATVRVQARDRHR
jgi:polyvinyl alcohol dehydrogenase (cytochrome)